MENATSTYQKSDSFTTKDSIDLFKSIKNNLRPDRPTVWLYRDTKMQANTMRSMLSRYRKDGLITEKIKIVEIPGGVIVYKDE